MSGIAAGTIIAIPCDVKPGPFSGERLISFETVDGVVSGFVREDELRQTAGEWFVRGQVRRVEPNAFEVWVRGNFFTTNGVASVPRDRAVAA